MTLAAHDSNDVAATEAEQGFHALCSTPTESRWAEVDGHAIHYLSWNGDEADKPALLFVHGFVAHARWWSFLAPHLTDRFRVFAMDFSGMGDSAHRSAYSLATWRDEVAAVLRAIGEPSGCTVVGHSFGGSRCADACAAYPALFRRLLIIDSYFHFDGDPPRKKSFAAPRVVRYFPDLSTAAQHFRLLPPQWCEPWMVDHLVRHSLRESAQGWSWKFDEENLRSSEADIDSSAMLASVTVPTFLIHGQHSRIATRNRMGRVARLIPNCALPIEIPMANHHLMLDQPVALITALRAILACQDARRDGA